MKNQIRLLHPRTKIATNLIRVVYVSVGSVTTAHELFHKDAFEMTGGPSDENMGWPCAN